MSSDAKSILGTDSVSTNHNFWRVNRAEAESNRGPAYQPNGLPLGQIGPQQAGVLRFASTETTFG